ncbi:type VI secretion system-associated protein TagO [Cobetia marina]|uniref:type VI secretion system-associated protein TagO n=1 Tax=Cobetia marina TaxID=28258 RepID=UPI001143FF12|nr:type VI secretion system-associated protein TagO [Cobetia marina]GED41225.1 hypothetical protein HHA02_05540 [Cobetia marina]
MRVVKAFIFIILASYFIVYMVGGNDKEVKKVKPKEAIPVNTASNGSTSEKEVSEKAQVKEVSNWYVSEKVSQIDDSKTVTLSTVSSTTIPNRYGSGQGKASLILRCMENTTSMYMKFNGNFMADIGSYGNVVMRIDDSKAFTRSMNESTDNMALGLWSGGRSIPVIKKLLKGEKLVVRATPFNESSYTMTFPLRGLSKEIGPLREACHW